MSLLEVRDLKTHFRTDDGIVKAVDGVSFSVEKGQTLGIVGESGCGKSVTCLTIMGLNPKVNTISSGEVRFNGEDILHTSASKLRQLRGDKIAMIFQDPMTSLNPVYTIGAAADGGRPAPPGRDQEAGSCPRPSSCSRPSASRAPTAASRTTRISSRAVCASA